MYQNNNETERGCLLISLSFFCFMAFLYFSYSTFMYCGFTPKQNQTAEGVIVKSAIEESNLGRRGYSIDVTYEYHVKGNKYVSNRICCSESANESSRDIVNKYPIGTKVTVYYREKNPSLSVIEPRLGRGGPVLIYSFGFLAVWSFIISFSSPNNSGWLGIGMFGLFILLGYISIIIYPPNNSDSATNNPVTNIVLHSVFISIGLSCLIYSYILKRKNA